jgi:hypothetical protein
MSSGEIPPEVVQEVIEFLSYVEANPRGPWPAQTDRLWHIYERWRHIIRQDGQPLLDESGTMTTLPGLSSWGRIFLLKHRCPPQAQCGRRPSEDTNPPDFGAEYRNEGRPTGELLTVRFCKERFNVSGKDLSTDLEAKRTRRSNPAGRGHVYRFDVVERICNRKSRRD